MARGPTWWKLCLYLGSFRWLHWSGHKDPPTDPWRKDAGLGKVNRKDAQKHGNAEIHRNTASTKTRSGLWIVAAVAFLCWESIRWQDTVPTGFGVGSLFCKKRRKLEHQQPLSAFKCI